MQLCWFITQQLLVTEEIRQEQLSNTYVRHAVLIPSTHIYAHQPDQRGITSNRVVIKADFQEIGSIFTRYVWQCLKFIFVELYIINGSPFYRQRVAVDVEELDMVL